MCPAGTYPRKKTVVGVAEWMEKFGEWYVPEPNTGCWLWMGRLSTTGYGITYINGRKAYAHRAAYEFLRGRIPDGLTIDHLCRVRTCVNPDHMEPVTRGENVRRGEGLSAKRARQTHCIRGHELCPPNLVPVPSRPNHRRCRECEQNRRERRNQARRRTA